MQIGGLSQLGGRAVMATPEANGGSCGKRGCTLPAGHPGRIHGIAAENGLIFAPWEEGRIYFSSATLLPSGWSIATRLRKAERDRWGHYWREEGTPVSGCLGAETDDDVFAWSCELCRTYRTAPASACRPAPPPQHLTEYFNRQGEPLYGIARCSNPRPSRWLLFRSAIEHRGLTLKDNHWALSPKEAA